MKGPLALTLDRVLLGIPAAEDEGRGVALYKMRCRSRGKRDRGLA
jgi:hypothetical protein